MIFKEGRNREFYDEIIRKKDFTYGFFASIVELNAALIECKDVRGHSTDKPTSIETLIVRVLDLFDTITRIELYMLTGIAPELLDKDLENLRAQGYLEYVIPFESEKLQKNISKIENEVGIDLIIKERLDALIKRKTIKQYNLTNLGKRLLKTNEKDSFENVNIDFAFLRKDNNWRTIGHITDKGSHNRFYRKVDETEYIFFESFLKEYADQLSPDKNFKS